MSSDLAARLQAALGDAYRLERELGGGGMSRLFVAEEVSLHRRVVIKVLPPQFASDVSAARFRQEVELAAHLQHPNILPVLAAGTRNDLLYYIIPYVPGESLRHRLTREGKLPVTDAVEILCELADALAYAHAEGILHRDVKPENVLLMGRHASLTDFGVARALAEVRTGERLTETGLSVGTPGYMAPEQAAGERHIDAGADVYSLAVVGYEMLAGKPPFEGPTAQAVLAAHLTTTPTPLRSVRPETPDRVAQAIARALVKNPGDRLRTAAEFRDAIVKSEAQNDPPRRLKRTVLVAAALLLALVTLGWWVSRPSPSSELADDLIAVAPFEVLGADLELWREGLVDVLARNFDGAGSLRTVSPTTVIRRWQGRADPSSAAALGRGTGAGLAVFGQLLKTSGDSVKATVTLLDVAAGRVLGEFEVRNQSASMDRVADSLTMGILRELGRYRPVGAVRATAFYSTSLPALKAFLQGEQYYRRASWDSAFAAYRQVVAIDSGFALAWRRMSSVLGWTVTAGESLSVTYAERAARLNRGLAPRDSLLITAESLASALYGASHDTSFRAHRVRLYNTLQQATARYPNDPEIWHQFADAHYHFPIPGQASLERILKLFDRAVASDSAFAESYIHPVWLSLYLGRPVLARRYIRGYLAQSGRTGESHARAFAALDRLISDSVARGPGRQDLLKELTAHDLEELYRATAHWTDPEETAVHVARAMRTAAQSGDVLRRDPSGGSWTETASLAYRGHLKKAYTSGGEEYTRVAELAPLDGIPSENARNRFGGWLRDPPLEEAPNPGPEGFNADLFYALPWWAAGQDTTSLAAFAAKLAATEPQVVADMLPWLGYGRVSAAAYLSLARGDTAKAIDEFRQLPDTVCSCPYDRIVAAQLLLAKGRGSEALKVFEGQITGWQFAGEGLWRLTRGRAYEAAGQREKAMTDYRFVMALWHQADSALQPYVNEAQSALARLTNEPQP